MRRLPVLVLGLLFIAHIGTHFLGDHPHSVPRSELFSTLGSKALEFMFFFPLTTMVTILVNYSQRGLPFDPKESIRWAGRAKDLFAFKAAFYGAFWAMLILWPQRHGMQAPEKWFFEAGCYAFCLYALFILLRMLSFQNRVVERLPSPVTASFADTEGRLMEILWALALLGLATLFAMVLERSGWRLIGRVGFHLSSGIALFVFLIPAVLMQAMVLYAIADLSKLLEASNRKAS